MCFFFLFYGFSLCSEFDVIFIDSAIFVKTSLPNRVGGVGGVSQIMASVAWVLWVPKTLLWVKKIVPVKLLAWVAWWRGSLIFWHESKSWCGSKTILFTSRSFSYPAGNYMIKVNNKNTRARCEICLTLTIKTPERCQYEIIKNKVTWLEYTHALILQSCNLFLTRSTMGLF